MKKLIIISLALILALGGLGAAYAAWTDQVVITETVNTGDLCVGISSVTLLDGNIQPPPYYVEPPAVVSGHDYSVSKIGIGFPAYRIDLDKNVGWADYTVGDPVIGPLGNSYSQSVTVNLHNVYPCYYNHADFWLQNCGTIPWKILEVVLEYDDASGVHHEDHFTPLNQLGYKDFDFGGDVGVKDFEIQWGDNWFAQTEPVGNPLDMSMGMHVLQDEGAELEDWSFKTGSCTRKAASRYR